MPFTLEEHGRNTGNQHDMTETWVKVFRIIPELRIFEADFP